MEFAELQERFGGLPFVGYYVRTDNGQRSISDLELINHIEDNLYVGGCLQGVDLGDFFSHVISMYKWEAYTVDPSTKVHTYTMYDSHDMSVQDDRENPLSIDEVAQVAADALDKGGNVLVHCQAGINRSNLVAALALMKRGRTAAEAIDLLRKRRHAAVLANSTFEAYVRNAETGVEVV